MLTPVAETTVEGPSATIPPEIRERLSRLSFAATETCGVLLGEGLRVTAFIETPNTAADPTRAYEVSAEALLAAHARGEIIGIFHSHPNGDTRPSARDEAQAQIGWLYVIGARGALAAYVAR